MDNQQRLNHFTVHLKLTTLLISYTTVQNKTFLKNACQIVVLLSGKSI